MGIKIRQDGQWVEVAAGSGSSDPVGTIVVWAGSAASIPTDQYQLCDGSAAQTTELQAITGANVPDLRDKFIVGASDSTGDTTYPGVSPGATGGAATHTLTVDEMPSHNHPFSNGDYYWIGDSSESPDFVWSGTSYELTTSSSVSSQGGGQAHNNLPPYYALCYIIKHTAGSGGGGGSEGTDAGQGFFENDTTLNSSKTLPANKNVGIFGPYTIGNNVTLTVPTGTTFTVV